MLPFIIVGLTAGSVYALAGVGLVLTYKTSGVFNFAQGALATASAYLFYSLTVQHGMAWQPAALITILVLGPLVGLLLERVFRDLAMASLPIRVAATVGVLLIIQSVAIIVFGQIQVRFVPKFLPTRTFVVLDTIVGLDQVIVFAIGLAATVGLYLFFRVARTGIAMRAVVGDPDLLDISGTSPVAIRRWAWVIGSVFASASGVLLIPFVSLEATQLTVLFFAAFGAAAVGRFKSLPGTYLGGLGIGVGSSLATRYLSTGAFTGIASALPFLVLFVVLLVAPKGQLVDRSINRARARAAWTGPWQVQGFFGAVILIFLLVVPSFASYHLGDWTRFLGLLVMFLSLTLLVRISGQVSLAHSGFMAIGVCGFSHLAVDHGWPWWAAALGACLISVPVGAVLAIPAIRLSGLYLALATFGFGILLQYMFFSRDYMFGAVGLGIQVPRPGYAQSDRAFYYFALACAVAITALVMAVNRSRLGRLLRALGDSPTGLATSGTSTNITRLLVFCLSAALAAFGGILQASAIGQATAESYTYFYSLTFFVVVVIGLGGAPWIALNAAFATAVIPSYIESVNTANYLNVLFGITAIGIAIKFANANGNPRVEAFVDRLVRRKPATAVDHQLEPAGDDRQHTKVASGSLDVKDLRVTFGGLVAVAGATLSAPTGRITGLIGPNGAGKTTVFNACSGLNSPAAGTVRLNDVSLTRRGPASRARRGLGRTFQQMELFDSLTVWENVALGNEGGRAGMNPLSHLASSPATAKRIDAVTADALAQCDLLSLADRTVGSLSTGQRRLVELARCLAGDFQILLLDEPSSGLDRTETARFGEILRDIVRDRGVGILLVEHDMALVTEVCDYIYVLDFGKLIHHGAAADVVSSKVVQAAYLGGEDLEEELQDIEGLGDGGSAGELDELDGLETKKAETVR